MSDGILATRSELDDSVYSNFNHELKEDIAAQLREIPASVAQHAAWHFCGYIWFEDGRWHEEVWRWKAPVERRSDDDLSALIASVNDDYGGD